MDILNLLGVKGIVIAVASVVAISSAAGAVHYYNKHQREIGEAALEAKYAKLRVKGADTIAKFEQRKTEHATQLAKEKDLVVSGVKKQLRDLEAKRATDLQVFAATSETFRNWSNDIVPDIAIEQLRLHQQAVEERAGTSKAGVHSDLSK